MFSDCVKGFIGFLSSLSFNSQLTKIKPMANGKKSFVLYADLLTSVDHLTDEELGRLFRHTLEYVNDQEPVLEDRLLLTAWKPIERALKADLKKWEKQLEQRREAGRKSAEARRRKPTTVNDRQQASTDSVNVNVSVNVNDIPTIEEFTAHALSKNGNLCRDSIRLKYESWVENGWKNGNDKPIKNWKSSLTNTIPYIKTINNQNIIHKPHNLKDLYE